MKRVIKVKRLVSGALPLLCITLIAACHDKNTPTTNAAPADAGTPVLKAEYPAKVTPVPLAVKMCDVLQGVPGKRMSECCTTPPTSLLGDECTRLLSASLADNVVKVDEAAVDACAKAMNESLTGCDWVTPSAPPLPAACKNLIQGQQAAGARCRSPLDCQSGLHCVDNVCAQPEKLGSTCGRAVDAFAAATRQTELDAAHPTCAQACSLVTHRCEATPDVGSQCFANTGCSKGQLCIDGKCAIATPGTAGQPCAGTTCADGLRCVNKTCVAKAATGESCSSDFDCAKGGCATNDAGRTCGMTCSHVGDLDAIHKALQAIPTASTPKPKGVGGT